MDRAFVEEQQRRRGQRPEGLLAGLSQGAASLSGHMLSGLSGLVQQPMEVRPRPQGHPVEPNRRVGRPTSSIALLARPPFAPGAAGHDPGPVPGARRRHRPRPRRRRSAGQAHGRSLGLCCDNRPGTAVAVNLICRRSPDADRLSRQHTMLGIARAAGRADWRGLGRGRRAARCGDYGGLGARRAMAAQRTVPASPASLGRCTGVGEHERRRGSRRAPVRGSRRVRAGWYRAASASWCGTLRAAPVGPLAQCAHGARRRGSTRAVHCRGSRGGPRRARSHLARLRPGRYRGHGNLGGRYAAASLERNGAVDRPHAREARGFHSGVSHCDPDVLRVVVAEATLAPMPTLQCWLRGPPGSAPAPVVSISARHWGTLALMHALLAGRSARRAQLA